MSIQHVAIPALRYVAMARATATTLAQGKRLAEFRLAANYRSAREAALDNHWPESTYRAHENGTRTIGQDDAERYATRFRYRSGLKDISAQAILFGTKGSPPLAPDVLQVPLLSWVSAGKMADPQSQIPMDDVPLLAFADLGRGDFFALRVVGDSMDRISPDGSIIVVNKTDRQLVAGKPYVFSQRGEATFKVWRPEPPRLAPFSINPMHEPIFVKTKKDAERMVIGRVKRTLLDL